MSVHYGHKPVTSSPNLPPHKVHGKRHDQKVFSHTADKVHSANTMSRPMRGGIRL